VAVATAQSFELVTNDGWPRGELDVSPATRLSQGICISQQTLGEAGTCCAASSI